MKKALFILIVLASICTYSFAEEIQPINEIQLINTGYYTLIIPENFENSQETAILFNTIYEEFDQLFHFSSRTQQLPIRIFNSKEDFSEYMFAKIKQKTTSYTLLKNNNLLELVMYRDEKINNHLGFTPQILVKNLYLQYLYTAIQNPPLWIRDGFLAYFDTKTIQNTQIVAYNIIELSPWLEYAKNTVAELEHFTASDMLITQTKNAESYDFSSYSWALVSFLLHTEKKEYNRIFHESLVLLEEKNKKEDLDLIENTTFIYNRFKNLIDIEQLNIDFKQWLSQAKTPNERIQNGMYAYNNGDYEYSQKEFLKVLELKQDPLIYYYLGLNSFALKQHEEAEKMYLQSLEKGGEKAPIYWSLAINAFDADNYDLSKKYALLANDLQPDRYKTLVERLIKSIPEETSIELPEL